MLPSLPPLTFGQVKAGKDVVDAFTTPAADVIATTQNAADLLLLGGATQEQIDAEAPNAIQAAALALFSATFSRPEDAAPALPNP